MAYLYNWLFPTLETTQIDRPKKINLSPDIYLVQFIKTSEPGSGSNIWSYSNVYFDEDSARRQYNQYLRELMIGKITKYAGEHEQEYLALLESDWDAFMENDVIMRRLFKNLLSSASYYDPEDASFHFIYHNGNSTVLIWWTKLQESTDKGWSTSYVAT